MTSKFKQYYIIASLQKSIAFICNCAIKFFIFDKQYKKNNIKLNNRFNLLNHIFFIFIYMAYQLL